MRQSRAGPSSIRRPPAVLLHIHDSTSPPMSRSLDGRWIVVAVSIGRLGTLQAGLSRDCLFDVDLSASCNEIRVLDFLRGLGPGGARIFACPSQGVRAAELAAAMGATGVVPSPVSDEAVLRLLDRAAGDHARTGDPLRRAAVAGSLALDLGFQSLQRNVPLEPGEMSDLAGSLAESICDLGIGAWLGSIRAHHAGTYQHCLMVTGLATAFGQELGFSPADVSTLTVAALLHDVGKAKVDPSILDKPDRLTDAEMAVIRMHPVWGEEYLRDQPGFSHAVRDVVRHHHEYLDGSGYPDGLRSEDIGDLTRIVTVVDVFGALIQRRSYKPPMPAGEALAMLQAMAAAGKLERALVTAFGPVVSKLAAEGELDGGEDSACQTHGRGRNGEAVRLG